MDAYAAHPAGAGPFPLVVLFMDIWGLREELFGIARRIATHGYYCVVPNLFYREGKVRYERRNAAGKMVSFNALPAELQEEMRTHARHPGRQTARTDITAILDFCRNEPVKDGPAGSAGFCLGGRVAFHAGQEFPQRFRANASMHGTSLVTESAESPHRLVPVMQGEVYCGHAEQDHNSTTAIMAALSQAFAGHALGLAGKQLGAEHRFQGGDLVAERRRGNIEVLRRAGEMHFFGDRDEVF